MKIRLYTKNKDVLIGSFLVSLLILSKNLLQLSSYLFGNTGIFKALFVILGIYAIIKYKKQIYRNDVLVIFIILMFFCLSYLFANNIMLSSIFTNFLIYGLAGYAYSFCWVEEKRVIDNCLIIGTTWLIVFFSKNGLYIYNSFSFGYLMLPLSICSFIKAFESDITIWRRLCRILVFALFSMLLIINGSRGPIACFILFIMTYFFPLINNTKKRFVFYFMFIIVFITILNYKEIIVTLHELYPGKINFIEKSYLLLSVNSDITNGRLGIFDAFFKEYSFNNFIFGIGIGTYESTHISIGYTHNLLLSLMTDYGLAGLIIFAYIILNVFRVILRSRNNYLLLLFSVSVIHLMFSGTYWESFEFWLLLFTINKLGVSDRVQIYERQDLEVQNGQLA